MTAELTPEERAAAITGALNDPGHAWTQAQVIDLLSLAMGQPGELDDAWSDGYVAGWKAAKTAERPPAPHDMTGPYGLGDLNAAAEIEAYRRRHRVDQSYARPDDFPGRGMAVVLALREEG